MNDKKILAGGAAFFVAAIVSFLFPTIVLSIAMTAAGKDSTAYAVIGYIVSYVTQILFVLVLWLCFRRADVKPDYGFKNSGAVSYAGAVIAAVIGVVCFYLISSLFSFGLIGIGYKQSGAGLDEPYKWVISGIRVLIFAPVCEELLMRGGVLTGTNALTRGKKRGEIWSVLLCGVMFMLLHMNPEQTVYQFLFGCLLAMLTIASGSIIPAITAHMLNNGIALILEAPFASGLGVWITRFFNGLPALFVIAALVLAVAGFAAMYFICKLIKKKSPAYRFIAAEAEDGADKSDRHTRTTGKMFYVFGAVVCVIVWIIQLAANLTGT